MARVKRGVTAHAKHKKVYKAAKGFCGRRKNTIRAAKAAGRQGRPVRLPRPQAQEAHLPRALDPAPQRRRAPFGMTYSVFINGLSKSGITVDRKVLSDLAINEPAAFQAIVEKAKAALAA